MLICVHWCRDHLFKSSHPAQAVGIRFQDAQADIECVLYGVEIVEDGVCRPVLAQRFPQVPGRVEGRWVFRRNVTAESGERDRSIRLNVTGGSGRT